MAFQAKKINFDKIALHEDGEYIEQNFRVHNLDEFQKQSQNLIKSPNEQRTYIKSKITSWLKDFNVIVSCISEHQAQKVLLFLEKIEVPANLLSDDNIFWQNLKTQHPRRVHVISLGSFESISIPEEHLIFLREDDFFGKKNHNLKNKQSGTLSKRAAALSFGDLKPEDYIVHKLHGIGIYKGLTLMTIQGVDAEFIQIQYKGNDRLYLPVYRVGQIQKYSGPKNPQFVDKLGGTGWQKTQIKVKAHLRDLASELLNLYAKRSQLTRKSFFSTRSGLLQF